MTDLDHPDASRRVQAVRSLQHYLDPESTGKLYALLLHDENKDVWPAVMEILATDEARLYRDNWRPLLRAGIWRRAILYNHLRSLGVDIPNALRLRMLPVQTVNYLRQEIQTRPLWLLARVVLVVVIYLGLAWWQGWFPFLRWEPVPGAPQEALSAMEVVNGRLQYVGSFDYGLARHNADGSWTYWLREGLPTGAPAKFNDPNSNVRAIDAIAADPSAPGRVYILVRENGLFFSDTAGESWAPIGSGQTPASGWALDVWGQVILIVSDDQEIHGSGDGGRTWRILNGQNNLPDSEFDIVRFDPLGVPYAGGKDGLYRGRGTFPWVWEKVAGIPPVRYVDFGPDQRLYLAVGWPRANQAACYTPAGGLTTAMNFGDNVITTLVAHPDQFNRFYVGTINQVREVNCDSPARSWPGLFPEPDINQGTASHLALVPAEDGNIVLIQAATEGLYRRPP
jgi:hypothetical protein